MKNICIITNKYPNPLEPNVLVFVQQLAWSLADKGIECSVVCPMPININLDYMNFPSSKIETTDNGNEIKVYMPKYIGFGQSDILKYNPAKLTTNNFTKAVSKVIKSMENKPSAVYGHFVTPAGIAAARIGKKYDIPSFMAYGEATYMTIEHFGFKEVSKELEELSGVVAVSTKNKDMLTSKNVVEEEKIGVFPNSYRPERFHPKNKIESRKMFGLPLDKFIVGYVGSYDHRKGIARLEQAVEKLDDVYFISAGQGELRPTSDKCLYSDIVNNERLAYFYSAVDCFALPTLNEGCSNAIIEAMACGLPIVSSDRSFNYDILDESCSITINPENVYELAKALDKLKNDSLLITSLKKGSLEKAKKLSLNIRSENIISFINNRS